MSETKTDSDKLEDIERELYGSPDRAGLVHKMNYTKKMIESHVEECQANRREMRLWLMGILGTVIAGLVLFWANMPK